MKCDQAKELMAARLVETEDNPVLLAHLAACSECAGEMDSIAAIWDRLGDFPVPEPSREMSRRFASELDLLIAENAKKKWHLTDWWPRNPVWQMGFAAACLFLGLAVGMRVPSQNGELATLREEIAATREMVVLSMLRQQSATGRLQGVEYSGRLKMMDAEVVAALVQAVERDSSVNVRLAAIDALGSAARDEGVRRTLTRSLGVQDSPMVQAALIDYFLDARDRGALGAIRQLEERPDLNPSVRERSQTGVRELSQ